MMLRRIAPFLIFLVLVFPIVPLTDRAPIVVPSYGSRYDQYVNSTWYIDTDTPLDNQTIYLRGDLVVNSSFTLSLVNTTIDMDLTSSGQFRVLLNSGSRLSLVDSAIVNKTQYHPGFYGTGCVLYLLRSRFRGFGSPAGGNGVEVVSSKVTMRDSNVTYGEFGLHSTGGDVRIDRCNIYSHSNHGIYAEKGTITVKDSLVTNNLEMGIWLRFASEELVNVAYSQGPWKNNQLDLQIDRLLSVNPKSVYDAILAEVDVFIYNSKSTPVGQGNTGLSASSVEFQLKQYTLFDDVETNFAPFSVECRKADYEDSEGIVNLTSNMVVNYTLYPEGYFDAELSVESFTMEGSVLEADTIGEAEVLVGNTGNIARNVTVLFKVDDTVMDRGWTGEIPKNKNATYHFFWAVKEGLQTLSVVIDPDGNVTEGDRLNNEVSREVRGVVMIDFSAYGPRKVYVNNTVSYGRWGIDYSTDSSFEYRFNDSGEITDWSTQKSYVVHLDEIGIANISMQTRNYGLEGPWSEEVIVEVFESRLPVATFTADQTNSSRFGVLYHFDASDSLWYDFGEESSEDLAFNWSIDGERINKSGAEFDRLFRDDGAYDISLTVEDPEGRSSVSASVVLVIENKPPIAQVDFQGGTINTTLPFTLHLSAEETVDWDDDPGALDFTWRVGDEEYYGNEVDIIFDEPGDYEIILTVTDDDNAMDNITIPVTINENKTAEEENNFWTKFCIGTLAIIILIILIVLIVYLIRNPEKRYALLGRGFKVTESHLKLNKGKKQDFLIIKHPKKDLYRKYELYNVFDDDEHTALCVVWESAADEEWRIVGSLAGAKDTVIEDINNYLDRDTGLKYSVDYWGSGTIVKKEDRVEASAKVDEVTGGGDD
jgi:hypothetical protein